MLINNLFSSKTLVVGRFTYQTIFNLNLFPQEQHRYRLSLGDEIHLLNTLSMKTDFGQSFTQKF